jgi:hypothetical protein
MSAPQPQVLESVQQLANWFARLAGRGETPDPAGATYQRLTQGLSAAEIAQAQDYARRAETLRQELIAAEPGTQLYQLPGYAALGTTPVVSILHDFTEEWTRRGGNTRGTPPIEEFRGGAYFSLAIRGRGVRHAGIRGSRHRTSKGTIRGTKWTPSNPSTSMPKHRYTHCVYPAKGDRQPARFIALAVESSLPRPRKGQTRREPKLSKWAVETWSCRAGAGGAGEGRREAYLSDSGTCSPPRSPSPA